MKSCDIVQNFLVFLMLTITFLIEKYNIIFFKQLNCDNVIEKLILTISLNHKEYECNLLF